MPYACTGIAGLRVVKWYVIGRMGMKPSPDCMPKADPAALVKELVRRARPWTGRLGAMVIPWPDHLNPLLKLHMGPGEVEGALFRRS